jgi:outer membrane protein TolC
MNTSMKYPFLSAVVALVLLPGAATAQEKLALGIDKAIALGLENSRALHSSLMKTEYADAKSSETSVLRFPKISFGGTYTRLSDVPPFSIGPIGNLLPAPVTISSTILDNYNLKMTLQQPLFTGWRLQSGANLADYTAQATNADYRKDRADLIYNIQGSYWNLYKAGESKKVLDETVAMMEAHVHDVQNFFEQGIVTKNEVLKIEVQLSNARVMQMDAENNVRLAKLSLNNTLGIPLPTDITLADTIQRNSDDYGSVDACLSKALEQRPELRGMEYRLKAGESAVTMARSGWYPQVYLVGNYLYARPNQRIFPSQDRFDNTWDVSLSVSLDIWNWGTTIHQTNQAQAQLAQAEDGLSQVRDGITLDVTQNYLNYKQSGDRISVADKGEAQAEENYRITDEKFKSGLALNTDLLDAEIALLQSRWNRIQALVDHQLAAARLQRAMGQDREPLVRP